MVSSSRDRMELFDGWAERYDESVRQDDTFPFAGYESVLDTIVRKAAVRPGMRVLDVGIGTGKFPHAEGMVWGVDFSAGMLEQCRERLPHATLVQADLTKPLPAALRLGFDRIVSAYVLHEFASDGKMKLLQGRILLGRGRGDQGACGIGLGGRV